MRVQSLGPLVWVPLAATAAVGSPMPVWAQSFQTTPATYEASTASFANGEYGTIRLYPGYGFTLDFSQTGQVVQRAWLDDMSAIGIDFSNGTQETIEAQFVHLKLIPEVNFQEVLRSLDGGTLLTLIAYDPVRNTQHRYQFRIFPAQGVPTHTALNIQPEVAPIATPASLSTTFSVNGLVDARPEHIQMGLGSFMSELSPDQMQQIGDVSGRVNELIALMHNGTEATAAAVQVGLSMQIVNYFAMRGLQASPANPLGLIDEVLPLELQGYTDSAIPGEASSPQPALAAPSIPPPLERSQQPSTVPQFEATEPEIPPSDDDLVSKADSAAIYQARVQEFQAELDRLPAPVRLDADGRQMVNFIKIGSGIYGRDHHTDLTYQPRVVALLAYLEAGQSLPEASRQAQFDEAETSQMLTLAEEALDSIDW
ncbi:MAG: hypothetical protein AB4050_08970 [Synechococcus sp.]